MSVALVSVFCRMRYVKDYTFSAYFTYTPLINLISENSVNIEVGEVSLLNWYI